MNIEIIKSLKERAKEMLEDNYDRKIGDEEIYTIICELENFYTAYEKEKEKNKQIKSKLDEKNIPIETLLAELDRLEDIEDRKVQIEFNNAFNKGVKSVEDKIKAKIEIRKEEKENCKDSIEEKYLLREIYVLQSLLEKE